MAVNKPKKATFIPLGKIMSYLGQTAICIKYETDPEKKEQKRQIAQSEIAKFPNGVKAGRECMNLDNAIVKLFRQAGLA